MATHGERDTKRDVPSGTGVDAAGVTPTPGTATISGDPASSVLTGYPGPRVHHSETGAQDADDAAAGVLTGYQGTRTAEHVHSGTHGLDDPVVGVLTGYPGARATHSRTGGQGADDPAAGVLTGYPGTRTARHVDTGAECAEPVDAHRDDADPDTAGSEGHD